MGARKAIDTLAEEFPDEAAVFLTAAELYTVTGDPGASAALITRAGRTGASRAALDKERGRRLVQARNGKVAASVLSRAVDADADDLEAQILLVQAHLLANDFRAAERAADDIATRFGDDPGVEFARGLVHLGQGRSAPAIETFEKVLKTLEAQGGSPRELAEARTRLGIAYFYEGKLAEALAELDRATLLHPASAEAHYHAGLIHMEEGRLPKARAEFQAAVDARPGLRHRVLLPGRRPQAPARRRGRKRRPQAVPAPGSPRRLRPRGPQAPAPEVTPGPSPPVTGTS